MAESAKDRRAREAIENLSRQLSDMREERDALAAHVEQIREAFMPGADGTDGGRLLAIGYVLNQSPTTSLARRDARMKAEAFAEAGAACIHIEKGQNDLAWMHKEVAPDGEEYVGGNGIPYSNKAFGAQHCRDEMARLQSSYSQQTDTAGEANHD
ncbi:hypothetical protein QWY79_10425 [Halomonas sabkhae]|uniref:hypothetical protein n=1 Tax=Halomonas sabkhae TaxID=626223 RepID=UPI0025B5B00A|nr:hypothetical protein [Halomonas sabkhae]MDN3525678.1 hypothetical protein [Halomonas sabkhae]